MLLGRFPSMLDFRSAIALVAMGLALGSCGDGGPTASEPEALVTNHKSDTGLQEADLGPLTYQFDPDPLTAADVETAIPPEYEASQLATKLIPRERARLLGQLACTYGQSGQTSECNAAHEIGLAIAYLPRPVAEYRQAFENERLDRVELDGVDGFSFTAQAEGSGTEYHFFGLEDRTILLARQFNDSVTPAAEEAMGDVIHSLSESLDRRIDATD